MFQRVIEKLQEHLEFTAYCLCGGRGTKVLMGILQADIQIIIMLLSIICSMAVYFHLGLCSTLSFN